MFNLDFLKGGALLGLAVGFWDKIKAFLWKIISIVVQRVEIGTEEAHEAVIAYLVTEYKRLRIYDKNFGASYVSMRDGKYGLVPFEKFGDNSMLFKRKDKKISLPFIFSNGASGNNDSPPNGHNSNNITRVFSTITCVRGLLNIDEIIEKAVKVRNNSSWQVDEQESKITRFDIFYLPDADSNHHAYINKSTVGYAWYRQKQYRLLGIEPNEIGRSMTSDGKALENLFFPKRIKDLIKVVELWVKSKDWYQKKNIPWKRGWLLYGPPGTGKTALARGFAEDLNMPIYVYSLAQMSNSDLTKAWKNMQSNIPCIALIEDIDNVFHGRKNITASNSGMLSQLLTTETTASTGMDNNETKFSPLTFDCLLNCLDGVDKTDGVFTIITTNDISKIDEAIGKPVSNEGVEEFISTRPGRIDKAIKLDYMEAENKLEMAIKILGDFPEQLKGVLEYIETNIRETPAQFQEYCAQIAIQQFWEEKDSVKD
jgi:hypothetical protein